MKNSRTQFVPWALGCLASVAICHAQGIITTVAGSDPVYPGTSYSALSASFGQLSGVAVSPVTGEIYFASQSRSLIVTNEVSEGVLSISEKLWHAETTVCG